jgi:hypothetical protein
MRISLIGGVERNEQNLEQIARSLGHTLDFHGGHMKGRGVDDMHRQIERADVVIVATNVNSHGAMHMARKLAKKFNLPFIMATSCNPTRFRELLGSLGTQTARAA